MTFVFRFARGVTFTNSSPLRRVRWGGITKPFSPWASLGRPTDWHLTAHVRAREAACGHEFRVQLREVSNFHQLIPTQKGSIGLDSNMFRTSGQSSTAGGQAFASQLSPLAPVGLGPSAARIDSNKLENRKCLGGENGVARSHGCAGVFFGFFAR